MTDFLKKISSYNLFNYLFPGVLFVILANTFTSFNFIQDDIILGVFLYYFVGLVISRIGSLFVEPALKRLRVVKFSDYKDFVEASTKDEKLETLSEVNNMYRTLCSLFLMLVALKAYESVQSKVEGAIDPSYLMLISLTLLFLFAYGKQTRYVVNRIKAQKDEHS